jgi:dienelactone hydrolase
MTSASRAAWLAAVVLSASPLAQHRTAPPPPFAFTHVTVIDVANGRSAPDMTVVVSDRRISAIGRTKTVSIPKDGRVVGARGKFLIPGLWDMHIHSLTDFDAHWMYPLLLAHGVTGVRELGTRMEPERVAGIRREILEGTRLGPRYGAATGLKYIPAPTQEYWNTGRGRGAAPSQTDAQMRRARKLKIVRLMHDTGVNLLAGTDAPNPFVYPGFSNASSSCRLLDRKALDDLLAGVERANTGSAQGARFEITPQTVLIDERFRVTLDGAPPGQDITIRLEGNSGMQSSASFRSDDRGRVEIPDPMRLVWSATNGPAPAGAGGAAAGAPAIRGVQPLTFTAEAGGRVIATQTVTRRALAENVRVVPVRERGLAGTAYYPPDGQRHPAMIVLPGAQGGIPGPGSFPGGLASRGYVVLALAYFNAEGLPPLLQNIPLEYSATAVEWLKAQPSVDTTRVGVLGTSKGGELALLLGATYPSMFRVVVANVPSNVVWPGLSDESDTPAWTLNGKPVPSVPARFTSDDLAILGRERFLKRMQNPDVLAAAEIPVERIDGPVLLFSAKDDQAWPSDIFAARVVDRLKAHQFTHPVEHYSYENAGHSITRPFVVTSNVRQVQVHAVSKRPNMLGGTPEGQARANEDSWEKLLAFLDKYLRK